ncbi:RNA-polymerase-associated protein [Paraglaciecola Antarctic GD virus 1]|nr:RNA-polymerase-associated protein [Paraglaciecola Antarctic GD virus 1]
MIENEPLTKISVSCGIDMLRVRNPELTYLEACLQYASDNNIDPMDIHTYVNGTLFEKIKEECNRLNLLKGKSSTSDLSEWL